MKPCLSIFACAAATVPALACSGSVLDLGGDAGSHGGSGGGAMVTGVNVACTLPAGVGSRWIAFDSDRDNFNRDIYLIHADGSEVSRLTTDPTTEKAPAISNDGAWLVFVSDRSGSLQIYKMNLATKAVTQLTSLPAGADEPSWSPDGTQIAFSSGISVYLMNADGTGAHIVGSGYPNPPNPYEYPVFTLDGSRLVFDRLNEIDSTLLDGTGFQQPVQNTTATIETPAMASDGIHVVFAVEVDQVEQLAIAPLVGSTDAFTAETLTPASAGWARKPAWGPSNVITFEHGQPGASGVTPAKIALTTGRGTVPCDITSGNEDDRNPSWTPSGFQPPQ